jgi:hypothetical protein
VNALVNGIPVLVIIVFILLLCVRNARLSGTLRRERRDHLSLQAEHATCPGRSADPAVAATRVARMMADLGETFSPISEAAMGEKKRLEAEGWSPTIAEQRAFMLYCEGMSRAGGHIQVTFGPGEQDDGEQG